MSLEQDYYDYLVRTDHPVFRKVYGDVTTFNQDTPFNAVFNYLLARQLVKLRADVDLLRLISYAHTVPEEGIAAWEETYFGYVKVGKPLADRVSELVARFNQNPGMAVPDVLALIEAITGLKTAMVRNMFFEGWALDTDTSVLDASTIFAGDDQASDAQHYVVIFTEDIDSALLAKIDEELRLIEKAGSRHTLIAPQKFWVLDVDSLGVGSITG